MSWINITTHSKQNKHQNVFTLIKREREETCNYFTILVVRCWFIEINLRKKQSAHTARQNCAGQTRLHKYKLSDLVCLRPLLCLDARVNALSTRSKRKRRSVPDCEPHPPAASTSEVHKYNWKENGRKELSLGGQQRKWHRCLESPQLPGVDQVGTRCQSTGRGHFWRWQLFACQAGWEVVGRYCPAVH